MALTSTTSARMRDPDTHAGREPWEGEAGVGWPGCEPGNAGVAARHQNLVKGMEQTLPQSLGREDPLEEGMATHSSILAWRIPRTAEPGGLRPTGSRRAGRNCSD